MSSTADTADLTQADLIYDHLMAGKSITPATALVVYGISRLSSAIEDLRRDGVQIDCIMRRDEMGKQYGEYRLRKPITVGSLVQIQKGHGYGLPQWVRSYSSAKVLAVTGDTALVRFQRGKNLKDEWLNHKELLRAD